jgi:sugar lactone lactonase YvrE
MSIALDSSGNLFISDSGNHRVRKVTPGGVITTVAGNGGISAACTVSGVPLSGPASGISLSDRTGLGVGGGGNLYIADTDAGCVRRVDSTGTMTTVAGDGNFLFAGDGGSAIAASLDSPLGVTVDAAGNLFISDTGNLRVRKVVGPGTVGSSISTVAGNGLIYSGDSSQAVDASLNSVQGVGVAADASGNIYVADSVDNLIRKISVGGIITTVAGNGCFGFSVANPPACDSQNDATAGDFVPAVNASLAGPTALAVDSAGNIFIADASNQRIRKVDTLGIISTVAGNGTQGFAGDGYLAVNAELSFPSGVAVDAAGNLFIGDTDNHRVRKVDGAGNISTFAGTGTGGFGGDGGPASSALLNFPAGVALDATDANLFIADLANHRVRRVTLLTQTIATVAGNGTPGFGGDGGPASGAMFDFPTAVALDGSGNLFVADFGNQRIRRIDALSQIVTTVAGSGIFGFGGDGGPANLALLANPSGLAVDALGNLFIADTFNNRVRKVSAPVVPFISFSAASIAFDSQVVGTTSTAKTVTVNNAGDAPLVITQIGILAPAGGASPDFAETDSCSTPLAVGGSCTINVTFTPSVAGDRTGTLVLTDNGAGSPQALPLAGTGTTSSIALSQTSLVFGNQGVGSTSPFLTLALTSTGSGPLSIAGVVTKGDFAQTNNCGASVPSLTTCTISATFTPTDKGARSGTLTLNDGDVTSPQTIALSGTGVQAYTLLADRTSATVLRGTDTATFNFSASSIYNFTSNIDLACTGNSPALCSFSPSSIAVGQNSVLTVSNLSAVTGNTLTFSVAGTNGPQTSSLDITLSIADFSMTATPPAATVTAGQTATYSISIQPSGGFNQPIALNCSGAPLAATCSVSPLSISPDGTHPATITVNVTTAAIATADVFPISIIPGGPGLVLAFFCFVIFSGVVIYYLISRHHVRYLLAALALFILTWVACGGGNTLPLLRGTPTGTYSLSVAAASGGLSHTTNLSLTVK